MKLIIKDANLSVNADLSIIKDVSIDEFYALLSEEQKKEIKKIKIILDKELSTLSTSVVNK